MTETELYLVVRSIRKVPDLPPEEMVLPEVWLARVEGGWIDVEEEAQT